MLNVPRCQPIPFIDKKPLNSEHSPKRGRQSSKKEKEETHRISMSSITAPEHRNKLQEVRRKVGIHRTAPVVGPAQLSSRVVPVATGDVFGVTEWETSLHGSCGREGACCEEEEKLHDESENHGCGWGCKGSEDLKRETVVE